MADTAALTIVKEFTYREGPEEWSNTYHLDNVPPDLPSWTALADLVVSLERAVFSVATKVVTAIGHEPGTVAAIFEKDYRSAAGGPFTGLLAHTGHLQAGDAAAWIKWSTTQLNSRGKPIWLRSYFHDVAIVGASDVDKLELGQHSALQTYGNEWANGMATTTHGTYRRAGPRGAVAQVASVSTFVTTRTLERRGRRRAKLPPGTTIQYPAIQVPGPVAIN